MKINKKKNELNLNLPNPNRFHRPSITTSTPNAY